MTAKDKISQTLMQLHANVITWVEAEKVIFPLIENIQQERIALVKQEGVVEYLVKKLMDTVEAGIVEMGNSLTAVRKCLDKLESNQSGKDYLVITSRGKP